MNPADKLTEAPGEAKRYADALREARQGSPRALDDLVDELSPMLWRVARKQGLDHATAEDVVQTCWLILMKKLDQIERPEALPGWLATTARREAWRARRSDRRESPSDQPWDDKIADQTDLDEDVADRMGLAPRYRILWRVVRQLPERCRGLIQVVAYTERPDYDRVASALGMPRGAIGPNRGRCLAKLRELLHSNPEWNH